MTLGIVCGFRAEQEIAARISPLTALGWCQLGAARGLIDRGATMLLSFGLAGGLDPALRPGDLILPGHVITTEGRLPVSPDLHELLAAAFPGIAGGDLAASDNILATATRKSALYQETGAAAADMESGGVAAAALAAGVPFAVIRAISDPAGADLPPAALVGLTGAGRPDLPAILLNLLAHPAQLPSLLRLAAGSRAALAALTVAVPVLADILQ